MAKKQAAQNKAGNKASPSTSKRPPKKKKASSTKKGTKKKPAAKKKSTTQKKTNKSASEKKSVPQNSRTAPARKTKRKASKTTVSNQGIGNAIISGDGNFIVVQTNTQRLEDSTPGMESAVGPNPYKGLFAFREEDTDWFFGREELISRLWERFRNLLENGGRTNSTIRVLPILGPSGSGKSSVARAGLIPELARRPIPGRDQVSVAVLTPGTHPIETLASVLARIATNDSGSVAKTREFADELVRTNDAGEYDGLRRIADALPDTSVRSLILLVDQFEEVFSLCDDDDERNVFVDNVLHASRVRSGNVSSIITLRTDFLDKSQRIAELNGIVANEGCIIPAMSQSELRRAISEPAKLAGHPLDDAIIDVLIHETEGCERPLPLLQISLTRIWDGLRDGVQPAETLKTIGGVSGALDQEAERIFESLRDDEKNIARRVFLKLVQLGQGTRDTRRRAVVTSVFATGDNPKQVEQIVRRFAGARLITLSAEPDGTAFAEVTHETLFEHWHRLDEWLESSRDELRFQRRLDQAARHWDEHDRADGLLWRPPDLDLLDQFFEHHFQDLTPLPTDFFVASRKAEDERVATDDEQRVFLHRRLAVSVGLAIVTTLLAIVAVVFSRNAIENQRLATISSKAAQEAMGTLIQGARVDSFQSSPAMKSVRTQLLNRAQHIWNQHERLRIPDPSDARHRYKLGMEFFYIGEIYRFLGDANQQLQAEQAYDKATGLLVNIQDKSEDYRRQYGRTCNAFGEFYREAGDPSSMKQAAEFYDEAIATFAKLHTITNALDDRREQALALVNRGIVSKEQWMESLREKLRTMQSIDNEIRTLGNSTDDEGKAKLKDAEHRFRKATRAYDNGASQYETAVVKGYKDAIELLSTKSALSHARCLRVLAMAHTNDANFKIQFAGLVQQSAKLIDDDPKLVESKKRLAENLLQESAQQFQKSIEMYEKAIEQPNVLGGEKELVQLELANAHNNLSNLLNFNGATDAATALQIYEQLAFPAPNLANELGNAYNTYASALKRLGTPPGQNRDTHRRTVSDNYQKSYEVFRRLMKDDSGNQQKNELHIHRLGRALCNLAAFHLAMKNDKVLDQPEATPHEAEHDDFYDLVKIQWSLEQLLNELPSQATSSRYQRAAWISCRSLNLAKPSDEENFARLAVAFVDLAINAASADEQDELRKRVLETDNRFAPLRSYYGEALDKKIRNAN